MADDYQNESTRSARFEKRRRTTKLMNYMLVLAGVLILLLIILFFFSGDDESDNESEEGLEIADTNPDDQEDDQSSSGQDTEDAADDQASTEDSDDQEAEEESEDRQDESDADESREDSDEIDDYTDYGDNIEVEESDEENVKAVIRGNWEPYETQQEEPHTIDLNDGSQDRQELEQATAMAINGHPDEITYWWFASDGNPNYIEATIEDQTDGEIYRVHLEWVENEGWQPQLVKVLEENDQLYRFQ